MVAAPLVFDSPTPVADIFAIRRSYSDLVKMGQQFEHFFEQYESDPEKLDQIRREFANAFWDSCLTIAQLDPTLEATERDRIVKLAFRFCPAEDLAKLLKLSPDVRDKCLDDLESIEFSRFLPEDSLKKVIAKHRPVVKHKFQLEETLTPEMVEKILPKLALTPETEARLVQGLQAQAEDGELSATTFVDICHQMGIEFEQIRKILLSKEYTHWIENKALHYQHKSTQLLGELDRVQLMASQKAEEAIHYQQQCERLQQEKSRWHDEKFGFKRELERLKQQLAAREAAASSVQQETEPDDVDNTAPMPKAENHESHNAVTTDKNNAPYESLKEAEASVTQYRKHGKVGILKDGQIIDQGTMIGQIGEQIRVRLDTGGSTFLPLTNLVLLSEPNPQPKKKKPGGGLRKPFKGFGNTVRTESS